MNRAHRRMLFVLAAVTAAGVASVRADTAGKLTTSEYEILRRNARERERRILFNNDGADASSYGYGAMEPPPDKTLIEDFLHLWGPREGSQIDAVFYSTTRGSFGLFSHRTEVGTMFARKHTPTPEAMNPANLVLRMFEMGTDPLREYTRHCRERDIEIFWSMRMNDNHDASPGRDYLLSDFKLEHPECLFSRPGKPANPGSGYAPGNRGQDMRYGIGWTSVDYGCEKVREFAYRVFREVAENYDIDGIEMDFFRHMPFFRSTAVGAPAGKKELEDMTGLIRRIREMLDEAGRARGRPILLAARVPDSVGYCRDIGLDIERWADAGLVDIFIMGGEFLLNEWAYSVEFGRGRDIQVYACLTRAALYHSDPRRQSHEGHRAMAREAWAAGIDGVYTFNLFNTDYPIYWEAGSPQTLKGLDSPAIQTLGRGTVGLRPG